jgi:hypothetical protein
MPFDRVTRTSAEPAWSRGNPHAHPQDCLSAEQCVGVMPGKGVRAPACSGVVPRPPGSRHNVFSLDLPGDRGYAGPKMARLPSPEPVTRGRGGGRRDRRD